MKILVNAGFGGFSPVGALKEWGERFGAKDRWGGVEWDYGPEAMANRTNPNAIRIVEELGSRAVSGPSSNIEVVEIPDNVTDWQINEYDGAESVIYVVDGKIHWA